MCSPSLVLIKCRQSLRVRRYEATYCFQCALPAVVNSLLLHSSLVPGGSSFPKMVSLISLKNDCAYSRRRWSSSCSSALFVMRGALPALLGAGLEVADRACAFKDLGLNIAATSSSSSESVSGRLASSAPGRPRLGVEGSGVPKVFAGGSRRMGFCALRGSSLFSKSQYDERGKKARKRTT